MLFLEYFLWIAPHIVLALIIATIFYRHLQWRLPFFLGYLFFELAQFFVLLSMNLSHGFSDAQYQEVFVFGSGVSTLLKLGVVFEVFSELLVKRARSTSALRSLLHWTTGTAFLGAVTISAVMFSLDPRRIEKMFHTLSFCSSVVLCVVLVMVLLLSRVLQISWRSYTVGVVLGFGIISSAELATIVLRTALGSSGNILIDVSQMVVYQVSVVIWLVYAIIPERSAIAAGNGPEKIQLEYWNQEVQRMVRQ
jgi:hypothetical protein